MSGRLFPGLCGQGGGQRARARAPRLSRLGLLVQTYKYLRSAPRLPRRGFTGTKVQILTQFTAPSPTALKHIATAPKNSPLSKVSALQVAVVYVLCIVCYRYCVRIQHIICIIYHMYIGYIIFNMNIRGPYSRKSMRSWLVLCIYTLYNITYSMLCCRLGSICCQ